jgi:hypothetical protein
MRRASFPNDQGSTSPIFKGCFRRIGNQTRIDMQLIDREAVARQRAETHQSENTFVVHRELALKNS